VMPAIWQHCTDDDLARTRAAFMAAMPADDADLSRRIIVPALSPQERTAIMAAIHAAESA